MYTADQLKKMSQSFREQASRPMFSPQSRPPEVSAPVIKEKLTPAVQPKSMPKNNLSIVGRPMNSNVVLSNTGVADPNARGSNNGRIVDPNQEPTKKNPTRTIVIVVVVALVVVAIGFGIKRLKKK